MTLGKDKLPKRLHFNVGSKECSHTPFHLWLALPDAKSTSSDWDPQNRGRFVTAALLKAVGEAKLIDIKPRIERLYRNHEIHELKVARKFAA